MNDCAGCRYVRQSRMTYRCTYAQLLDRLINLAIVTLVAGLIVAVWVNGPYM